MIAEELKVNLVDVLQGKRKIVFLVGAGLSAESGIPTFRGKDGFWIAGSQNYTPQEMGTKRMFDVNADEVWRWYLYRISICNAAQPNDGHRALSRIENLLGSRFALISQNVDGLNFRAESQIANQYLIHGDLRYMRCADECTDDLFPIPVVLTHKTRNRDTPLLFEEKELLTCPNCGEPTRPHVLWFDEYYNDKYYHLDRVMRIAKDAGLLFVIGTSGATNLPQEIVRRTLQRGGVVVDINPTDNLISAKLDHLKSGFAIRAKSTEALVYLEEFIREYIGR